MANNFTYIKIITIVTLTLILWNCKKDKPEGCWDGSTTVIEQHSYDTIKPSDYIMAYPGSWWEYDNGRIDSCKGWVEQIIERPERDGTCLNVFEDLVVVPKISNGLFYKGSIIVETEDYQGTKFIELIDTNKSNTKISYGWGSYPVGGRYINDSHKTYTSQIIEHLDSFDVNGMVYYDIIHCRLHSEYSYFKYPAPPPTISNIYYAKYIGKIYSDSYFTSLSTSSLINHYIAPH